MRAPSLLPLVLLLCAGCSWLGNDPVATGPKVRSIDEDAGSYMGVALGDTRSDVHHAFGKPAETSDPAFPLGSEFDDGGPLMQRYAPLGYSKRPSLDRWEDASFLSTSLPSGVWTIVVDDPRAATQRAVAIGDPLSTARARYPGLRCEKERDAGEYGTDPPYCTGKLADDRYIWFGNDPIRIIALSKTPMG
jgi:hypothetical protein